MKRGILRLSVAVAATLLLLGVSASAQSWSKAEQEVWQTIETIYAADSAGNTAEFLSYFHQDYRG